MRVRWRLVGMILIGCVALTQFIWRGEVSLRSKSPIWDEFMHLQYGINFTRQGPVIDAADHPYPATSLLTLPLVLSTPHPAQVASKTSRKTGLDIRYVEDPRNLFPPRRVNLALAAASLLALALLVGRLLGCWVGLVTLAVGSMDPCWLAQARFITTDILHGAAIAAGAVALYHFHRTRRWRSLLLAGIALAFACWSKFSGALLVPGAFLLLLFPAQGVPRVFTRRLLHAGIAAGLLALGGGLLYLLAFHLHALAGQGHWGAGATHLASALGHFFEVRGQHQGAFLLGSFYPSGTWLFYPVLLVAKTPLALLAMLALTACLRQGRTLIRDNLPLFVVPLLYLLVAVITRVNLGHRHLTLVLPFLWIVAAAGLVALARRLRLGGWMAALLLVALALEASLVHPHYLPFTNNLFGGVDGARSVAVESSTDWGQDLPALAAYLEEHPPRQGPPHLAYFGTAHPFRYGIRPVWRPCGILGRRPWVGAARAGCRAPAEVLAISATCLYGAASWKEQDPCYAWLREREPDAVLGGSILIFREVAFREVALKAR